MVTYKVRLIILAVVIVVFASYTALDLAGRVMLAQVHARHPWQASGTILLGRRYANAMGIGI